MSPTNPSENIKTIIRSSSEGTPSLQSSPFLKWHLTSHANSLWLHCCIRNWSLDFPTISYLFLQTWDPLLAQIAKAWASHCEFAHNQQLKQPHKLHPNFTSLGENLWTGSLSIFSVSSAITDWYDEVKYYDFKTRKCNKVCGHYTQVSIWPIFSRNGHLMGEGRTGIWCEENRVN